MSTLVCPRDRLPLAGVDDEMRCPEGHRYPHLHGVPVMLLGESEPTLGGYWALADDEWALDVALRPESAGPVHPYVDTLLVGTCGNLYRDVRLDEYPIPHLRLPAGEGRSFLEIGSNWGRWCVAAARLGYRPTGIDPSLGAMLVGSQVARKLGVDAEFVVADGRHLPFDDEAFDVVFSYSVLQHFSRSDALACLREATRVLAPGGTLLVQMPNVFGPWNLLQQARRRFRDGHKFDVRYWTPQQLRAALPGLSVSLEADGFFTLNGQLSDCAILDRRGRLVVRTSEMLRRAAHVVPALVYAADSVFVRARKEPVESDG